MHRKVASALLCKLHNLIVKSKDKVLILFCFALLLFHETGAKKPCSDLTGEIGDIFWFGRGLLLFLFSSVVKAL